MVNPEEPPSDAKDIAIPNGGCGKRFYHSEILQAPIARQHLCGAGMQFGNIYSKRAVCGTDKTKRLAVIVGVFLGTIFGDNRSYGN
jgi:hypothetical protein